MKQKKDDFVTTWKIQGKEEVLTLLKTYLSPVDDRFQSRFLELGAIFYVCEREGLKEHLLSVLEAVSLAGMYHAKTSEGVSFKVEKVRLEQQQEGHDQKGFGGVKQMTG